MVILAGVVPFGGGVAQGRLVEQRRADAEAAAITVLAARGQFTSVMGFPWVFGGIVLLFGTLALRNQRNVYLGPRIAMVILAGVMSFGGGGAQGRLVEQRRTDAEAVAITALAGTPAPSLAGLRPVNVDGASLAESTLDGKVIVITFWATWCSPCRREMAELQTLYNETRDVGFEVVGITRSKSADADPDAEFEKAVRYIDKREITYPIGFDASGTVHGAYRVTGVPSTVLIDRDGRIVDFGVGLPGGRKIMEQARTLLGR